jgi:hypothetical protein
LEGIQIIQRREIEGKIQFAIISKNKAGQYHVSITGNVRYNRYQKQPKSSPTTWMCMGW